MFKKNAKTEIGKLTNTDELSFWSLLCFSC